MTDPRRALPSVEKLLQDAGLAPLLARWPRQVVAGAVRETLDAVRSGRIAPPPDWSAAIDEVVSRRTAPSLRPVINATGVVLHTNLGRAPLAEEAIEAACAAAGYATLEFDLPSGSRGSRHDHCARALAEVAGAEAGLVVNNAAGALVLALNALAAGREVLVSRGELIEIGGSFRIPDIIERSGAVIREVGTTNRTHLRDYADARSDRCGAILTVHQSNFAQHGYVTSPDPRELAALGREHGVPYLHDVGSGLLLDLSAWGLRSEPRVGEAIAQGADLVIFSGDKLLGGPQAGCLAGSASLIERCRSNPLARALRADKMTLAALAATLALYQDPELARSRIPVLRMLTAAPEDLARRAGHLERLLAALPWPGQRPSLLPGSSTPGGGSFPDALLPTTLVALDPGEIGAESLALRIRMADPPVVARVQDGLVLLDPRTLDEGEFPAVVGAVQQALES
jgi:L-seryl-tRNA(Ser) seleniumtransferase